MTNKGSVLDTECFYFANLAVLAEQVGNFVDAAAQWRRASGAAPNPGSMLLYEEAAKRCERRLKERSGGKV